MQSALSSENLYVVEKIVGKKVIDSKVFYKVKWQGYDESDCTWEKLSHLRYVPDLIKDYEKALSLQNSNKSVLFQSSQASQPEPSATEPALTIKLPDLSIKEVNTEHHQEQDSEHHTVQEVHQSTEEKTDETAKKTDETPQNARPPILTRSAHKKEKREKKQKQKKLQHSKKDDDPKISRLQKKEMKKMKKMSKEESKKCENERQSSSDTEANQDKAQKTEKPTENSVPKGEEDSDKFQPMDLKIRLIVAEDESDIRDYVVAYPNGTSKIFNTCQMFYAHPVEFVTYLEKRTLKLKK